MAAKSAPRTFKPTTAAWDDRVAHDAEGWTHKHYSAWAKSLTVPESRAFYTYRTPGAYWGINHYLRAGVLPRGHAQHSSLTTKDIDRLARTLDGAIARATIPEAVITYRTTALPKSVRTADGKIKLGATFFPRQFNSLSLNRGFALGFHRKRLQQGHDNVLLEVSVPAGTHAAAVDSALHGGARVTSGYTEQELLLGRDYGIKLVGEAMVDGEKIIRAEVVPPAKQR
jgi:hypothetical protein